MFFSLQIEYKKIVSSDANTLRLVSDETFFVLQNASGSISVRLRKRKAYPGTFCRSIQGGGYELGYGDVLSRPDREYLLIRIMADGSITVARDEYITLPFFYAYQEGLFAASNQYDAVLGALPSVSLSKKFLVEQLIPRQINLWDTFIQEIRLLGASEKLDVSAHACTTHRSQDSIWRTSVEAAQSDPNSFARVFEGYLDHFIETRIKNEAAVFQVSGSIDSATLPLYLSQHDRRRFPMAAYAVPGRLAASQKSQLDVLAGFTNYPLIVAPVNETTDFPLAEILPTGQFYPFHSPDQFRFSVLINRNTEDLARQGATVICTGEGADDMFENIVDTQTHFAYGPREREDRQSITLPPYATKELHQAYVDVVPDTPSYAPPKLPTSVLSTPDAVHNNFIERGLWPVSPFIEPGLYAYCQGLPAYLRDNKNILRAYHQARGYIPEIYNSLKDEHYDEFLNRVMLSDIYRTAITALAQNAVTAKLGYVDTDRLLATFDAARTDDAMKGWLPSIYNWMCVEISLQSTANLRLDSEHDF